MEIIAKRIRELREGINLSQKKIAKKIGIAQPSVYRYENNIADLPSETLLWYENYFDVSLDYIFGRTDKPQGKPFKYQPKYIDELVDKDKNLKEFVEMCFDPKSSMNDRLKNALLQVLSEKKENENQ
ncbi:MAG: helix-turn-helix domain-containing protein [Oscillospiraceae bacterium]|jgi:transcriptional regulator with XRE-family HTH domain|nr:helix-turn-helix domain-containing protein [Oscillospiraceae bacterium]